MKHSLFVVFTIIVISLTSSSCPTHPVYMEARLDGPLNIVPDSFYMERSKEYRFASVNFNFGDEMSVSLPLVETDKVNMGGKTLLDEDLDQDSLTKSDSLYRKSIEDADGTYILSTKDSLRIIAPSHPLQTMKPIKGNMARVSNSQCNTNRDILLFDLANFQASKAVTTFNKQIQTQVVSIIS